MNDFYKSRRSLSESERDTEKRNIQKILDSEEDAGYFDMETVGTTASRTKQWHKLCKLYNLGQE